MMSYRTPSYRLRSTLPPLPEVDSTSTIGDSMSYRQRQTSNNPYRQGRDLGDELPQSEDHNQTSAHAGFNDSSASHSSITPGKATSSGSGDGMNTETSPDEFTSIPLQNLDPVDRTTERFLQMPLPPHPALVFGDLQGQSDNQGFHDIPLTDPVQVPQILQSAGPGSPPSMFENIKTVFASLSPLARDGKSDSASPVSWPSNSPLVDDGAKEFGLSLAQAKQQSKDKQNLMKTQVMGLDVRGPQRLDSAVTPSSSVYPSSPPLVIGLHLPLDAHRYNKGFRPPDSAQYNNNRGREFALAGSRLSFLDREYALNAGEPAHGTDVSDAVSIPDGSTVGNIYNHYLYSDPLDDFSDDDEAFDLSLPDFEPISVPKTRSRVANTTSSANDQAKSLTFTQRMQLRNRKYNAKPSSDPPQFALPKVPRSLSRHLAPSPTQGLGQSSSYGDTCNLLDLTEQTNSRGQKSALSPSETRPIMPNSAIDSDSPESHQRFSLRSPTNNPFGDTPQVVVDHVEESHVVYDDDVADVDRAVAKRLPLEREVSEALRRASGVSLYSAGSASDSVIDRYRCFGNNVPSIPAMPSRNMAASSKVPGEGTAPCVSGNTSIGNGNATDPADGFYHQGTIPRSWVQGYQQNVVRVPIARGVPNTDSSSYPRRVARQPEDDKDDWETVGGSALGLDVEEGFIGGSFKRTGSSIANTSDEGSFLEIDDFGSAENIAQHPIHPRYNAEYRQRELKNTRIPVFAPVYREHKVNGYLADSNRIRPQLAPFGYAPEPPKHGTPIIQQNPFNTPPPEVLPLKAFKPASQFASRRPNHFKPSLQTLQTESEDADHDDDDIVKPRARMTEAERREWMDDFSKHKLTLISENEFSKNPSPSKLSRPSSWQRMMILAGDGTLSNFNSNGSTEDGKASPASDPKLRPLRLPIKVMNDNLTEGRVSSRRNTTSGPHSPLTPVPLTEFFGGSPGSIKSVKSRDISGAQKSARRSSNRYNYPTNQLRPLELVANYHPSTPLTSSPRSPSMDITPTDSTPKDTTPNDFVYRSPLAPLKHKRWKRLYSPSQLRGIQEAAGVDDSNDTQTIRGQSSFMSSNNTPDTGTRQHLFEAPTLRLWKRDDSTRTDLTKQKTRVSITVLCLCALFPPLLLLYVLGGLDSIIVWWTNGRYTTYARKQKRWALIMMIGWSVVIFVGLVAFLVWWFSDLRAK